MVKIFVKDYGVMSFEMDYSAAKNTATNFEAWEPIRLYLEEQRKKCGWDVPKMKEVAGHSDKSRDHERH